MYRLIQDDDAHWYVIERGREDDFYDWCQAMADCVAWTNKWEPTPVNGPHTVVFEKWIET